jgi:tetratricopeptide (TPR) repeat protein
VLLAGGGACASTHAAAQTGTGPAVQTKLPPTTTAAAPTEGTPAPSTSTPAPSAAHTGKTFHNEDVGYSLQVPAESELAASTEPGVLATAPDGTIFHVFFEQVGAMATADGCWSTLFSRVGHDMVKHPQTLEDFRKEAQRGIDRGEGENARRIFLAVYPRADSCLVLAAEGRPDSPTLAQSAPMAMATFKVGQPSPAFRADENIESGRQLMEGKKFEEALHHFEAVLKEDPNDLRAQFGAGLAAYFAGPALAPKAVEYLSKAVASHYEQGEAAEPLHPDQYRDALMYLGLAYASTKQFTQASTTLAELVDRYPDDAIGRYNFACVLALAGDTDEALEQLRGALQRDPELIGHARDDTDLVSLHPLPAWKALLGTAESGGNTAH